jgi:hypothetical protein
MSAPKEDHLKAFEPFSIALGHMATIWAEYEASINVRIWELANVEKMAGACITSQLIGPGPRFRCLLALLELRKTPEALLDEFNSHHTKAETLGRQRNRYLHDPFLRDHENGVIWRMEMTAYQHIRMVFVELAVCDARLRDKIGAHIEEFDKLWSRVLGNEAWPREQFTQSPGTNLRPI